MTSKHYRWQQRWTIDRAAGLAVHECGLRVQLAPAGRVEALNEAATVDALAVKNGHNARAMVDRMLREAAALFAVDDPRSARLHTPIRTSSGGNR